MTVIDIAGAQTGGAARFRREAESWVSTQVAPSVRLIGFGESAEPRWLMRREMASRRDRRIATNNVSFLAGRGRRIVLLRNPLHFLRPGEAKRLPAMPPGVRQQTPIVRAAAHRADVIVVPSNDMADRVLRILPGLSDRVMARHHPLSVRLPRLADHNSCRPAAPYVLYPSMPSLHKDVIGGLRLLLAAISRAHAAIRVKVTCDPGDLEQLGKLSSVDAIGEQSLAAMDSLWAGASAAYSPFSVESFNYPVAESRAIGLPVMAVNTPLNREIGGPALVPFYIQDVGSLADALERSVGLLLIPDPLPFEPAAYFSWITGL